MYNTLNTENPALAYLDQNVWDFLVKGRLDSIDHMLRDRGQYQVIYSHVTLEEISRIKAPEKRKPFLDYLERLDAYYLEVESGETGYLRNHRPTYLYNELFPEPSGDEMDNVTEAAIHSMEQLLFKMTGGRQGVDLDSVLGEGKDSFEALLVMLRQSAKEMGIDEALYDEYLAEMQGRYSSAADGISKHFEEAVPDTTEFDGIKVFRDFTSLGPLQLNNIEPPGVIEQIWERLKGSGVFESDQVTIDMIFGDGLADFTGQGKMSTIQRINSIYHMLNWIGYFSDPKMNSERNFRAALSDQGHAGYAAYAGIVLSRDERFVKKATATYEYLNIQTEVVHVPSS